MNEPEQESLPFDNDAVTAVTRENFTEQMARFSALTGEKRRLESELRKVQAALDALEQPLLDEMSEQGMQSMRIGGYNLHIRGQLWAGVVQVEQPDGTFAADKELTCDALVEAGQGHFVERGFNVNSVSSYIRDLPQDDRGMPILPPELDGKIRVYQRFALRAMK